MLHIATVINMTFLFDRGCKIAENSLGRELNWRANSKYSGSP